MIYVFYYRYLGVMLGCVSPVFVGITRIIGVILLTIYIGKLCKFYVIFQQNIIMNKTCIIKVSNLINVFIGKNMLAKIFLFLILSSISVIYNALNKITLLEKHGPFPGGNKKNIPERDILSSTSHRESVISLLLLVVVLYFAVIR